ncbi:2OG-Fe(II) oxygenase family protein [Fluviispira multicolorata]|uniref:2OG-Fe(II) oxygenase family protein n=1 Tax=Fluviispira multicolorata TaxID=2654512 RepID=UPI001375BB8F|nr:2OG-Fe(II) oxygenase family protein [Fluviispira multicolorata]
MLPHTDFNQNRDFTVIFYISRDWTYLSEGELVIYEKNLISGDFKIYDIINPEFNTFFSFEISEHSWHSVKKIKHNWQRLAIIVDFDLVKNVN